VATSQISPFNTKFQSPNPSISSPKLQEMQNPNFIQGLRLGEYLEIEGAIVAVPLVVVMVLLSVGWQMVVPLGGGVNGGVPYWGNHIAPVEYSYNNYEPLVVPSYKTRFKEGFEQHLFLFWTFYIYQ